MEKKKPFPSSFFIRRVSISIVARVAWMDVKSSHVFRRLSFIYMQERKRKREKFRLMGENEREYWTRIHSYGFIYIYLYLYISLFLLLSPPLFIREIYDAFWSDRPFNRTVLPVWKVQTDVLHTFSFFPSSWLFIRIHSF